MEISPGLRLTFMRKVGSRVTRNRLEDQEEFQKPR
jgi:hypothetical protein